MEPQARGQGKGGKTGDNRCSAVRWPGLGPTSTTCCLSDPGGVTLTSPVSVSSTVKCRRPNASGRAAVSLLAGAIPQCVGGAHTHPAAKPPSTPRSPPHHAATNGASSASRLPPSQTPFLIRTRAKHGTDMQQALNECSMTQ